MTVAYRAGIKLARLRFLRTFGLAKSLALLLQGQNLRGTAFPQSLPRPLRQFAELFPSQLSKTLDLACDNRAGQDCPCFLT